MKPQETSVLKQPGPVSFLFLSPNLFSYFSSLAAEKRLVFGGKKNPHYFSFFFNFDLHEFWLNCYGKKRN